MKLRFSLLAAIAATLAPLSASAQAWLNSPDFSEGVGIRAGNLELHPGIGAEFGYDSNFFRESQAERPVDVFKLRITPSLTLSTLGRERRQSAEPPNYVFQGSAYASYFELFPADSENQDVAKRRNLGLGANAKLDAFTARRVGFDLLGNYVRIIEAEGRSDDLAGEGYNRDTVRGGGGVTWRPGGGLFEWRAGYLGTYNFFENDTYKSLNNVQHQLNTKGRWRFLPRSALLFDTTYTFVRYTRAATQQTDGDLLRSRIGFHGLVTYHLALMGLVGWSTSFYEGRANTIAARQFDSVIANAEARWFIQSRPTLDSTTITSGLSSVALGYQRTFNNSYYGSFYQRDRGYIDFSLFVLGAIASGLEFGVSRVGYPEVTIQDRTQPSVTQLRIDSRFFAEYRFAETMGVNGTISYDQVNSPVVNSEELEYRRWQAYLGIRWFM